MPEDIPQPRSGYLCQGLMSDNIYDTDDSHITGPFTYISHAHTQGHFHGHLIFTHLKNSFQEINELH